MPRKSSQLAAAFCIIITTTAAFADDDRLPWETGSYFPAWAKQEETAEILRHDYDPGQDGKQNGAALAARINALQPGQKLVIGGGKYVFSRQKFTTAIAGTPDRPIWIVAAEGQKPVLTYENNAQNVLTLDRVGDAPGAYLCFRGLEFTGGSELIKIQWTHNIWIDQCELHDAGGVAIAANSNNTHHLYLTRNHIHNLNGGTAEGMYLGANYGKDKHTSYSTIALNHIHDCRGSQGDGIELKQGSFNCWIAENHVHDTNYPCILTYGTYGKGVNLIERNVLYNSMDNTLQVQGEAVVRNNLIIGGKAYAFFSNKHQDAPANLAFIHNTIVTVGNAASLRDWPNDKRMVFANNAVYSKSLTAIDFVGGAPGKVIVTGNVTLGKVQGISEGFVTGRGLEDFKNLSWDGKQRDAAPTAQSPLIGAAKAGYAVKDDLTGRAHTGKPTVGAVGAD